MANIKQIKHKIKSVNNLKKITRALEVVSTVKLQKLKNKTISLKNFINELLFIIGNLSIEKNIFKDYVNLKGKELYIFISSEKGLCGSLNSKLLKRFLVETRQKKDSIDVFCIGKKGFEQISRLGYNIVGKINLKDNFVSSDLEKLNIYIKDSLSKKLYKNINIYYNFFKSVLIQSPLSLQVLPIEFENIQNIFGTLGVDINFNNKSESNKKFMKIEPTLDILKKQLLSMIVEYIIFGAILQNKAGEHASRMIAMKNAKDNCGSLVKRLTLSMNKARQSMITKEIIEIVNAKIAIEG